MSANRDEPPSKPEDVLFVHSPSERGDALRVVRKRADVIEVGEIRTIQEGRPIHGEVVKLTPRAEHEQLFDVDVLMAAPSAKGRSEKPRELPEAGRSGPAQVATDAYRENWDAIFGSDRKPN